jgi:Lar family restriction alleviation protein
MTTQPSDWAVELMPCPFCGSAPRVDEGMRGYPCILCGNCGASSDYASTDDVSEAVTAWNTRAPVARELDASGGDDEDSLLSIVREGIRNAESHPRKTYGLQLETLLRIEKALATPRASEAGDDTRRLDWIERTFRGMSNGERYLPLVMGWGKSRNGRTLREAADKYMAKETPFTGVTFVERGMPPGIVAEVRTRHDRVTIVDSDDAAMGAVGAGGGDHG